MSRWYEYGVLRVGVAEAAEGAVDSFGMVAGDLENDGFLGAGGTKLPDEKDPVCACEKETEDVLEEPVVGRVDCLFVLGDVEGDAQNRLHPAVEANLLAGFGHVFATGDKLGEEVEFEGLLDVAVYAYDGIL